MKNVISQSLGLDLVNINVYAKVYQNIPLSSRDRASFTFSEFEPQQRLGLSQMTFDSLLGYICQYQCVCKILSKYFKRFKSYRHFSTFFTNRPASKSSQTVRWQNQMFDYRALLEIQLSIHFLRVVQSFLFKTHSNRSTFRLHRHYNCIIKTAWTKWKIDSVTLLRLSSTCMHICRPLCCGVFCRFGAYTRVTSSLSVPSKAVPCNNNVHTNMYTCTCTRALGMVHHKCTQTGTREQEQEGLWKYEDKNLSVELKYLWELLIWLQV